MNCGFDNTTIFACERVQLEYKTWLMRRSFRSLTENILKANHMEYMDIGQEFWTMLAGTVLKIYYCHKKGIESNDFSKTCWKINEFIRVLFLVHLFIHCRSYLDFIIAFKKSGHAYFCCKNG